jgi:hypothetical protein
MVENHNHGSAQRVWKVRRSIAESGVGQIAVPAADLSLNGGGSIIRVTLPLSGLQVMGVPVDSEASDPLVMADLTLDPFGGIVGFRLVEAVSKAN